jgi:hypothetical protein
MSRIRPFLFWYGGAAAILAIGFARVLQPDWFAGPPPMLPRQIFWVVAVAAPWFALQGATSSARERAVVTAIVVTAAAFCNHVKYVLVDLGHYFPVSQFENNTVWQYSLHRGILALSPAYIPHSYRFLPDALIGVMEWATGTFEGARSANALIFYGLLYAFTFRLARRYLSTPGSIAVVVLLLMVYPVTNAWYAGQPIDPMSHLSFVVCMWALATGQEAPMGASLVVGCFAKESVLIMAPCRAFYGDRRGRAILLAAAYFVMTFAAIAIIRLVVNGGSFSYGRISGVEPGFVATNFAQYRQWVPQYAFSIGIFLPGAAWGWKEMDRPFRLTCLAVTAGVVISSAVFSWLSEVRNLVPAIVMLAVVNVKAVERYLRSGDGAADHSAGTNHSST